MENPGHKRKAGKGVSIIEMQAPKQETRSGLKKPKWRPARKIQARRIEDEVDGVHSHLGIFAVPRVRCANW